MTHETTSVRRLWQLALRCSIAPLAPVDLICIVRSPANLTVVDSGTSKYTGVWSAFPTCPWQCPNRKIFNNQNAKNSCIKLVHISSIDFVIHIWFINLNASNSLYQREWYAGPIRTLLPGIHCSLSFWAYFCKLTNFSPYASASLCTSVVRRLMVRPCLAIKCLIHSQLTLNSLPAILCFPANLRPSKCDTSINTLNPFLRFFTTYWYSSASTCG